MKYPKHSFEMIFSVTITVFLIFSQVKCTFTKLLVHYKLITLVTQLVILSNT